MCGQRGPVSSEVSDAQTPRSGRDDRLCGGGSPVLPRRRRLPWATSTWRAVRVRSRQVAADRARRANPASTTSTPRWSRIVADDPTDAETLAGAWQQDRWNDGGAHGNVHAFSTDGGETWTASSPLFSRCAGGTATSAVQATTGAPRPSDYQRATDPWVSYGPDGRLHAIALVFDNSTPRNAVLTAFSDDDGATWSAPRELRFDNPRALGNNFNDKETLTADPGDPDFVYATWQRIVSPSESSSAKAYENSVSYFSDAWFARSTDGGRDVGAGALDLPSRAVPADDRQPGRGAARWTAR